MGGRGCCFPCVCVREPGGVLRIPPHPCPIPYPPWLPAPFLLAHALAVLRLAAVLGGLVFHTWLVVACGSLRAFVPSYLHIFLLLRGISYCMYSVALHTLLCLLRPLCVSIVWAYLSLPGRACGGGHVLSATPLQLPSVARLSLCFSLLSGVAWHVTYLYLCCRTASLGGGVCGSLRAYILLCLRHHVCAYAGGIPFAPYVSGRAEVGMFSRLHLLVTFVGPVMVVPFSFALRGVVRHETYLYSAAVGVVVACLFLFFLFLCVLYFPLVVCCSVRAFFVSFFHPSCPFIPFCFSVVVVALLCLR